MQNALSQVERRAQAERHPGDRLTVLRQTIEHAAHLLPTQGPISVFVHHNTLHAFEENPFDQAVIQGHRVYGAQPYLSEQRYHRELMLGRIREADLAAVLIEDLGAGADDLLGFFGTRYHLRMAMLEHPLQLGTDAEVDWFVAETDALRRFRGATSEPARHQMVEQTRHWMFRLMHGDANGNAATAALKAVIEDLARQQGAPPIDDWDDRTWEAMVLQLLWRLCRDSVQDIASPSDHHRQPLVRHRDLLREATGEDIDLYVNELLIAYSGAFLDQGLARWPLEHRGLGYYGAFLRLYAASNVPTDGWRRGLSAELQRLQQAGTTPLQSIAESLDALAVRRVEQEEFIAQTLRALLGWAGMIWQMETNAQWTVRPAPAGSLVEFLAVRLILERIALTNVARDTIGYRGDLRGLRTELRKRIPAQQVISPLQRAFLVFQLAQVRGWLPEDLARMTRREWVQLVHEMEAFSSIDRRRIYHAAYERHYFQQALDALAIHARRSDPAAASPEFQVVCCLDDREESFRRHLEEVAPQCETFGVAGFYALAMYYRGAAEAHYRPLCPAVIKPQHYVVEEVSYSFESSHRRRAETRRAIGSASRQWHLGSRSLMGGVVTSLLGSLAAAPMVTRILFPRLTAQIRRLAGSFVQPPPSTQLQIERAVDPPGPDNGHVGYSVDEMADIVQRILQDMGVVGRLARLVIFIGHGSSSLNNPHESAYSCGACSGARGGPNARGFCQMANDYRVRDLLRQRGLEIPRGTVFVGAFHNTCDDDVCYFDLDRLPVSHRKAFEQARDAIETARARNAHERCRRFESAELTLSPAEALKHVEARAEDLSQARPEYNHATNALHIVGRRGLTRGLYLDRRAFLTTYDPTQDTEDHAVLARVLAAAIPVCAGISLEYYFSTVDLAAYGSGSKLPHNIAALLGVMEGAASDLRTGLSAQMVEIHEPMRILTVIETTPAVMLKIMDQNPAIGRLIRNQWIHLAVIDPESRQISRFHNGSFHPFHPQQVQLPVVKRSVDWYRGRRDHLGFAAIESKPLAPAANEVAA